MSNKVYQVQMTQNEYDDWLEHLTYPPNLADVKKPRKAEFGDENKHPCIKPERLLEWFIKLTTNEGQVVLDLFNGSGSTGVAAVRLGRTYIGIDQDPEYCEFSTKRIGAVESTSTFEVRLGDVIEQLKLIPDGSIDLILTDPPYNISMSKEWDTWKTNKDFQTWITEWGKEAYRVLRPGGIICSFASNKLYHYTAMGLDDAGFVVRDCVHWIYWVSLPKGKNLKNCVEPIYVGYKEDKKNGLKTMVYNIDSVRIPVKEKKNKKTGELISVQINNKVLPVVEIKDVEL